MKNIEREISRTIPGDIPSRYLKAGEAILTAYGCVLLERDTGKSYVYTAVNLKNGKSEVLNRRATPLTTSGVEAMIERLRRSKIAGAGVMEVDRVFGEQQSLDECQRLLDTLFREILPLHGYSVRKEQIALANHILGAICRRFVSLAEAEVGTGKTLAYLVPAIFVKRGRLGGYWNLSFYTGTPYAEMAYMPIVIATASIALQKALITDYIPELSGILLEHEFIKTPLTTALRKGREHYVCERNLRTHVQFERNPKMKQTLENLLKPSAPIDLAEIDGLNSYVKRRIAVPDRCDYHCPNRRGCPYLRFREKVQSSAIDIQVCNHNYLLADVLRRASSEQTAHRSLPPDGESSLRSVAPPLPTRQAARGPRERPLIPNYQVIIIDEAHKFLQAARSMYGAELSSRTAPGIRESIGGLNLKHEDAERLSRKLAKKLSSESSRLFDGLLDKAEPDEDEDEADRLTADIDYYGIRHIRNIRDIADKLIDLLTSEPAAGNGAGLKKQIVWELTRVREQAAVLSRHNELICWLETPRHASDGETLLCAIPKDLDKRLYADLWSKGIPAVLTSGTLSAAGDFSHIKRTLGIEGVGNRLTETSKPSPFDYREHAMIYISDTMPFPDQRNSGYILAVANEIEQLARASHGHAAVLFTSYRAMDMVWEHLRERDLPFPTFRLDKGGVREIERFKGSGNGILFAAGALWEGIDIPGDALSMLIIVKLPFAVPDPIGEYEQTLYRDMSEYKAAVIVPEMLIKLKQGFGRLIRTEKDTGCVAILDSRVNRCGAYRGCVLDALPDCYVTADITEVEGFYRVMKLPEYFE
jgi:ATP-dependent DNA helicase DinG